MTPPTDDASHDLTNRQVAPYGEWVSPITAGDLARSSRRLETAAFVAGEAWWSETRADEGGRSAVCRLVDDEVVDVLPPPWNARSRVHEYGGTSWVVLTGGAMVFAEYSDQRLYRLDPGATDPYPITPASADPIELRYSDLVAQAGELWCVREIHNTGGSINRDICVVPLEGQAATDGSAIRSVVSGSDFLAYPRVSPDGGRIAWIAWNHPQLPWDGSELRVADLDAAGAATDQRTLLGGPTESVVQPHWRDDSTLYVLSDRSGWWNLYATTDTPGAVAVPLFPAEADFAKPLWELGENFYTVLASGRVLTCRTYGSDVLALLDPSDGSRLDIDLEGASSVRLGPVSGDDVLLQSAGAQLPAAIRRLDLSSKKLSDVRSSVDTLPDQRYLPTAEEVTIVGVDGRDVHAVVYAPRNPAFVAPTGELAPFVAFVHGGPTAHVTPRLSLVTAYFTSRGIGVVDVNYGGSSGYGRAYRQRLAGQWGIVDVEDVVSVVRGLADAGVADPERLAIEGGSAGGWTVLAALTGSDVFACGVSYYGVADAAGLAANTHDFESRYLDGLVGPLPQAQELYERRAPVNNVDGLSCPVLLLQGEDDPVVPPAQSEQFRDAMVDKSIPHAYLTFAGESHGFRRAATIVAAREAELSFYGQVLGFMPPDVPVLTLWRAPST